MTARFPVLIVLFCAACGGGPAPPAKTAELTVPPMAEAGRPSPPSKPVPVKDATPPEERVSYEEALTRAQAAGSEVVIAAEKDMTDAELAGPMRQATFVSDCGAPNEMKVTVKVAVRRGRAVGVTVTTNPANDVIARCVDERVRRDLRWPEKRKMDTFTVTY